MTLPVAREDRAGQSVPVRLDFLLSQLNKRIDTVKYERGNRLSALTIATLSRWTSLTRQTLTDSHERKRWWVREPRCAYHHARQTGPSWSTRLTGQDMLWK